LHIIWRGDAVRQPHRLAALATGHGPAAEETP
jgi:hypothetical protein